MTRIELLDAAKLSEAVLLLSEAGERRLAEISGELAEIIEFRTLPFEGQMPKRRVEH